MAVFKELSPAAASLSPGAGVIGAGRKAFAAGRPIPGAVRAAVIDTAVAFAVLAVVILAPQLDAMPSGLEAALSMRITVRNLLLLAVLAGAWPLMFRAWGLYRVSRLRTAGDEIRAICAACATGALTLALIGTLTVSGGLLITYYLWFWLATTAATLIVRLTRRALAARALRKRLTRVLIVGSSARAEQMWTTLSSATTTTTYALAGFVDTPDNPALCASAAARLVGSLDDLESTLMRDPVDEVWIALPVKSQYRQIQHALHVCERVGVRTKYGADLFQTEVAWPRYDETDVPTITLHVVPDDHRLAIKRCLDVAGAIAALIVLSPLLIPVAVAIKLTSDGPLLYSQERCGLNRRRFRMLKFRTMVSNAEALQAELEDANEADGPVFKIADDPRITPIGRFLRRSSIDELPQLINVIRGEMSLVGPRPLPLRDVERFTCAADLRRFSVRPGLTCLWQISGRSSLSFGEWVRLDLQYIDSWSLALDLSILVRTLPAVVRGAGAQ
jgi:exopolysaccharide biosynthesis polyprenyl glycosylphosphotransferase